MPAARDRGPQAGVMEISRVSNRRTQYLCARESAALRVTKSRAKRRLGIATGFSSWRVTKKLLRQNAPESNTRCKSKMSLGYAIYVYMMKFFHPLIMTTTFRPSTTS